MTRRHPVEVTFQVHRDADDHTDHVTIIEQIIERALAEYGYYVPAKAGPIGVIRDDDVSTDTTTEGA